MIYIVSDFTTVTDSFHFCNKYIYFVAGCNDWDVRLVNGSTQAKGVIEVCINDTYGSVCNEGWSDEGARVVCDNLGYSRQNASAISDVLFNIDSGPININHVVCEGTEQSLGECSFSYNTDECAHGGAAGVNCLGKALYMQIMHTWNQTHLICWFVVHSKLY